MTTLSPSQSSVVGVGGASCTLAPRPVWQESSPGQDWTPTTAASAPAHCAKVSCWVNKHDDVALRSPGHCCRQGGVGSGQGWQGGAGWPGGSRGWQVRLQEESLRCGVNLFSVAQ